MHLERPVPVAIPSLDDIAHDGRCVLGLPYPALMALWVRCASVQNLLAAQLSAAASTVATAPTLAQSQANNDDEMLTVDQAAGMLGVGRRWIYRHEKQLPWVKRLSSKKLACSQAGLHQWLASCKA